MQEPHVIEAMVRARPHRPVVACTAPGCGQAGWWAPAIGLLGRHLVCHPDGSEHTNLILVFLRPQALPPGSG